MNDDLISRDAVLDACSQSINILDAMGRIEELPSVTPKQSEDAISRQAAIETIDGWLKCNDYNNAERHIMRAMQSVLYDLPSVTPKQRTGRCVWCSSPFRIEYYWIDCDGNTASFADEDKHIVATGIAKFCPNCGRRF